MARHIARLAFGLALLGAASQLAAQSGKATRVITTPEGTFLVRNTGPAKRPAPIAGGADSVLWTYPDSVAIPESCGLSPASGMVWVGQQLNNERLQRFAITGSGLPIVEFPGHHVTFNPACAAAAQGADRAAFLDQLSQGGDLVLTGYSTISTTDPLWTFPFPSNYNGADIHNVKISRNGNVVGVIVNDNAANAGAAYFFDARTGVLINRWTSAAGAGGCTGIDLTDDGSKALLCHVSTARLIDTATGTELYNVTGSGAGGRYNISGDGNVLVVGGFSLQIYKKINGVYTQKVNFSAPTSWFSWASAVSRDGTTVGILAHNYGTNYLNTDTRIWDVDSGQLLGTFSTAGTGSFQDSAWGAAMSDDGQRLAVCSWGTQNNAHPEVMIFDRSVSMIGSIDTAGSPFSLDMSGDGQYIVAGNKSVHANTFGNGGLVTLLQQPSGHACYANCDGSSVQPILNVNDFVCFQTKFAAGDSGANCDGSTTPPVLNVNDFICFQTAFAAGCP